MEKIIKGTLSYEITATETNYSFTYDRSTSNDLGALVAVGELLKFNKEKLLRDKKLVKGKEKIRVQDRISQVITTESVLTALKESILVAFLREPDEVPPVEAAVEEVK